MKRIVVVAAALTLLAADCTSTPSRPASKPNATPAPTAAQGGGKISHVIIVMQENRSFDSYFGTYPGADGLPAAGGKFTVCVNNPTTGTCVSPFHDAAEVNGGGPHGATNATTDIDGGKMDGLIAQAVHGKRDCVNVNSPDCSIGAQDVMGYHDAREIPKYWAYGSHYLLQDHLFEPNASWSLPQHLFLVSEWSAYCATVSTQSS